MTTMRRTTIFRLALKDSLPVLMGYTTMGFAAGVLLAVHGVLALPVFWGALSSGLFISGPLQYLFVDWVRTLLPIGSVCVIVLCVNFRYCLYGLSLLSRFRGAGLWTKAYLIMGITDETYALQMNCALEDHQARQRYCLYLTALDHSYWIVGVSSGALAGMLAQSLLSPENVARATAGIDFAMTSLFIVILVDQCRQKANRLPAFLGGTAALGVFGALVFFEGVMRARGDMLIPSILAILGLLLAVRGRLEKEDRHG
jgi:4-azaleucine resistance transporter AzlC